MEEPLRERTNGLLQLPTESAYTNEWYRKQFGRLEHINKLMHAEIVECNHHERVLRKELQDAREQRLADAAEIGRLAELLATMEQRVGKLESRMDKASEQFASLKKTVPAKA